MAQTLVKFPSNRLRSSMPTGADTVPDRKLAGMAFQSPEPTHPSDLLPCVLYEANAALELTDLSPNCASLLGVDPRKVMTGRWIWEKRMPREDFRWLVEKIEQLGETGAGSLIHRILDDYGLPRWVAHSFSMVEVEQGRIVRGCLIPLRDEPRLMNLDGGTIARFIHKLGNQFQLLNLAVNALEKDLQDSKDLETLQQSLEKAIDLTRAFSDYSQGAASVAETNLLDILSAAVVTRKASFASEGIDLEVQLDERLRSVAISTDPFLLESAIGAILQNSLEATQRGGEVVLKASVEPGHAPHLPLARISVTDTGCGIRDEDLNKVVVPFYTSKKDHDGMGLSIAARLFDVLGGHVRIDSVQGEGTEVIIAFPINSSKGLSDL